MLCYKRSRTLRDVSLLENNPFLTGNRNSTSSHHPVADLFPVTIRIHSKDNFIFFLFLFFSFFTFCSGTNYHSHAGKKNLALDKTNKKKWCQVVARNFYSQLKKVSFLFSGEKTTKTYCNRLKQFFQFYHRGVFSPQCTLFEQKDLFYGLYNSVSLTWRNPSNKPKIRRFTKLPLTNAQKYIYIVDKILFFKLLHRFIAGIFFLIFFFLTFSHLKIIMLQKKDLK